MADEFQIDKSLEAKYAEYKKRKDGHMLSKAKEICELNKQLHAFLQEKKNLKDATAKHLSECESGLFDEQFAQIEFHQHALLREVEENRRNIKMIESRICNLHTNLYPRSTIMLKEGFTFEEVENDWRLFLSTVMTDVQNAAANLHTTIGTFKQDYMHYQSSIDAKKAEMAKLEERKQLLIQDRDATMEKYTKSTKKSFKEKIAKYKTPEICALLAKRKTLATEYGLAKDLTFSADGDRACQ